MVFISSKAKGKGKAAASRPRLQGPRTVFMRSLASVASHSSPSPSPSPSKTALALKSINDILAPFDGAPRVQSKGAAITWIDRRVDAVAASLEVHRVVQLGSEAAACFRDHPDGVRNKIVRANLGRSATSSQERVGFPYIYCDTHGRNVYMVNFNSPIAHLECPLANNEEFKRYVAARAAILAIPMRSAIPIRSKTGASPGNAIASSSRVPPVQATARTRADSVGSDMSDVSENYIAASPPPTVVHTEGYLHASNVSIKPLLAMSETPKTNAASASSSMAEAVAAEAVAAATSSSGSARASAQEPTLRAASVYSVSSNEAEEGHWVCVAVLASSRQTPAKLFKLRADAAGHIRLLSHAEQLVGTGFPFKDDLARYIAEDGEWEDCNLASLIPVKDRDAVVFLKDRRARKVRVPDHLIDLAGIHEIHVLA
ncbi:hypothetical protein MKEN_01336200 [Mycena kentingensis (nom. inval.)]|nr:hypothetical protein MKEN_01336200 [Mycena kentingensis (nom. inval.)]